jgi:hypothetical protein
MTINGTENTANTLTIPECSISGDLKESHQNGAAIQFSFSGKSSCIPHHVFEYVC